MAETVTTEELEYLESRYRVLKENGEYDEDELYVYSWGLIHSDYDADIVKGISALQEILSRSPGKQRDCFYLIAKANLKLGNYREARSAIKRVLDQEPQNAQALNLQQEIERGSEKSGIVGMTIAGGLAAASIGLILALWKRR